MDIIKKYTAVQVRTENIDTNIRIKLTYGDATGSYSCRSYPQEEFDSEEEAIKYAYEMDKWATWMILPIIRFDNFN